MIFGTIELPSLINVINPYGSLIGSAAILAVTQAPCVIAGMVIGASTLALGTLGVSLISPLATSLSFQEVVLKGFSLIGGAHLCSYVTGISLSFDEIKEYLSLPITISYKCILSVTKEYPGVVSTLLTGTALVLTETIILGKANPKGLDLMVNTGIALLSGWYQNQFLSIVFEWLKPNQQVLKNVRWFIEGTIILFIGFPLTILICIAAPPIAPGAILLYLIVMVNHDKKYE